MTTTTILALVVPVDLDTPCELRSITPDLSTLQGIVGGWIEGVTPRDGDDTWHAYCDEEGKLKGLPPNHRATELAESVGWGSYDVLCGPVVFLGTEGPEEASVPVQVIAMAGQLAYDVDASQVTMVAGAKPYHRWPSNENADRPASLDRCMTCRVRRFSDDPETIAKAAGPCDGRDLKDEPSDPYDNAGHYAPGEDD